MVRILLGLVLVGLVAYIAYYRFSSVPLDAKKTIDAGIEQIKENSKLDAAQEQWLRVQLAIRDYEASTGSAPKSLEALVPKYFDEVPRDPSTGEVYAYSLEQGGLVGVGPAAGGAAPGGTQPRARESEDKQGAGAEGGIGGEGFVNPNTMEMDEFVYDPSGKRNPFQPFDFSDRTAYDSSVPPLERYSLGQLAVTAILQDSKGGWTAIVEDATGQGYPIRKGTKIGNANGTVAKIEKKRVHVVEVNVDFTGKENRRIVVMELRKGGTKSQSKGNKRRRM